MALRNCPECETELQTIRVNDATQTVFGEEGSGHVPLSYSVPETERSFFTRSYPAEGIIDALMCPQCGRTLLYARPS